MYASLNTHFLYRHHQSTELPVVVFCLSVCLPVCLIVRADSYSVPWLTWSLHCRPDLELTKTYLCAPSKAGITSKHHHSCIQAIRYIFTSAMNLKSICLHVPESPHIHPVFAPAHKPYARHQSI